MAGPPETCDPDCANTTAAILNSRCDCAVLDARSVLDALAARTPASGGFGQGIHESLFSPYALFVDRASLDAMDEVASAVFRVARNTRYIEHALRSAAGSARHDPGSVGGVLGLDFHLTVDGPRLIEINTNPGGLLLNAMALDAVRSCAPSIWTTWTTGAEAQKAAVSAWLLDLELQLGRMPARLAIVDVAPEEQFLYREFELYATAFQEQGLDCVIHAPGDLALDASGLHDALGPIEAVYNRLTDFSLQHPANAALAQAYLLGKVALSPHPRAHALFADKRNLVVLGDSRLLVEWGMDATASRVLAQAIPRTTLLEPANRDALWARRNQLFFKPAGGYGSRGSYRGDKLTRRVWDEMQAEPYVAQALTPPGVRILHDEQAFKADVRCFASELGVLLFAARLYQGQTTNMRTPGGGFATVLTTPGS